MGDEDMKDMPAGKNMGAALGTAPAASSSFGSDPFSMNSEDLRDWLKTKLIDKKHHKCADTLCDQQLAGKGFKEVTKDDLTKDYKLPIGAAQEILAVRNDVLRGSGPASGDTENKGQGNASANTSQGTPENKGKVYRAAEEKKDDQGAHRGGEKRQKLADLEETCFHPLCGERVTIKSSATHLLEVHGKELLVQYKPQDYILTIAENLRKRGGVLIPSLSIDEGLGLQKDGMLSCAFGVQNMVIFVHLDHKVGRLGLVKQNRCWTAHFTSDNLVALRDIVSRMGPDVVMVTGVTNDNYHWLGWAMKHSKWVVCGNFWSFHVEDEEWGYELKLN